MQPIRASTWTTPNVCFASILLRVCDRQPSMRTASLADKVPHVVRSHVRYICIFGYVSEVWVFGYLGLPNFVANLDTDDDKSKHPWMVPGAWWMHFYCIMIGILPHDVLRSVLEDYLAADLLLLVQLDIALCNHQTKADVISIFPIIRFAEPCDVVASREYLHWLASRGVPLANLTVDTALANHPPTTCNLMTLAETVHTVCFVNASNLMSVSLKAMLRFLRSFPNLTAVDLRRWWSMTDTQLLPFYDLLLQAISLEDNALSAEALGALVRSLSPTLLHLRCASPGLDDHALEQMLSCSQLKSIELLCKSVDLQLIVQLCCANCYGLQSLDFAMTSHPRPGQWEFLQKTFVQSICGACKALVSLVLDVCGMMGAGTGTGVLEECLLLCILRECPYIAFVSISKATCTMHRRAGRRHCEVSYALLNESCAHLQALCELNSNDLLLSGFQGYSVSSQTLTLLAANCGHQLEAYSTHFGGSADHSDFLRFLSQCPSLQRLSISSCWELVIDASLHQLPLFCPHISVLDLVDLHQLTDDGIVGNDTRVPNRQTMEAAQSEPLHGAHRCLSACDSRALVHGGASADLRHGHDAGGGAGPHRRRGAAGAEAAVHAGRVDEEDARAPARSLSCCLHAQ